MSTRPERHGHRRGVTALVGTGSGLISSKRRNTKVAKFNGGIPFTYGPLAYFLKNRVYLGEVHHSGKWFEGERKAIVDRATFDRVRRLLATKSNGRKTKRSNSGALLLGKLYDDRGNLMSPSFSTKNGVRYRFYVSSALLRGRKAAVGSVGRVSAVEIESAVLAALTPGQGDDDEPGSTDMIERVIIARDQILLTIARSLGTSGRSKARVEKRIPWSAKTRADIIRDPLNRRGQIFRSRRPTSLRREPVRGIDANVTVSDRPQHDVVIEWAARGTFVASYEAAAVDIDQHRPGRRSRLRREDIQQIAIGRAIFDVPLDLDALVGLLSLQRRIEPFGLWRIDDTAEFLQLGSDFLRHGALLGPRGLGCDYGKRNGDKSWLGQHHR
jgi:hypothetical protein